MGSEITLRTLSPTRMDLTDIDSYPLGSPLLCLQQDDFSFLDTYPPKLPMSFMPTEEKRDKGSLDSDRAKLSFFQQTLKSTSVFSNMLDALEDYHESKEVGMEEEEVKKADLEEALLCFNSGSLYPLKLREWDLMPSSEQWDSFLIKLVNTFSLDQLKKNKAR